MKNVGIKGFKDPLTGEKYTFLPGIEERVSAVEKMLETFRTYDGVITTVPGDSDTMVMSQKAVTEAISAEQKARNAADETLNTNLENRIKVEDSAIYLFTVQDADGKVIIGVTKELKLDCPDGLFDFALKKPFSLKVNVSDIADNLTTQNPVVPLSAKQGYTLKGLIDSLNERIDQIEASYTFITNDKYLVAIIDADGKVLWGIKKDGKLFEPTRYEDSRDWLFVITDENDKVVFGIKKDAEIYAPGFNVSLDISNLQENVEKNTDDIEELSETVKDLQNAVGNIEAQSDTIEVAIGKQRSYGTYRSELEASPFVDNSSNQNVGYKIINKDMVPHSVNKKIVVINHDDGSLPDLIGTRKIYNKYGFRGSFCCIFRPFYNLNDAKSKIANGRKLVNEGHSIGLHAMIDSSYWYAQRAYDVKPDGGSNFAPLLNEIRGGDVDGTGTNVFGKTITANTKASEIYYMSASPALIPELAVNVVSLSQAQIDRLNRQYCLYSDEMIHSGIDDLSVNDILAANTITSLSKTKIGWLEYYYNGLIDNSLGFSSTAATIAARFAEDYSVPSGASVGDYYPDAAHLKNGKMVYWNDTSNAHYADAKVKTTSGFNENDYQLVGKFTKGLYKDCFSTMNFEVMDRCIEVAEAFFRKYYGINHFAEYHLHGIHYLNFYYQDEDGSIYADRDKDLIYYPTAKWYSSRRRAFCSVAEIMAEFGMFFMKDGLRRNFATWRGAEGFYYGADGIRNTVVDFNNGFDRDDAYTLTQYLAAIGTNTSGMSEMSYSTFTQFMNGIDDWLKYFYQNGGLTNVSRNGVSGINIYDSLKSAIVKIVGSVGTGKIPVISCDTIANSPGILVAVELLLRFLKATGWDVVSYEEGRQKILSAGRNMSGNLFPNPGFERSVLDYFGGASTSKDAYRPDGWLRIGSFGSSSVAYEVSNKTVGEVESVRVLTMNGANTIRTTMWGLPAGNYKLSFLAKGDGCSITTSVIKNGDRVSSTDNIVDTYYPTEQWTEHEIDINIPDFHRNDVDGSDFINVVCDGYEDNVCCVAVKIYASSGNEVEFAQPKMYRV